MSLMCIFGRTCWVSKSHDVKKTPKVSVQCLHNRPDLVVEKIALMAVNHENLQWKVFMAQDDGLFDIDVWKQLIKELFIFIIKNFF